jgi:hypothetical protein
MLNQLMFIDLLTSAIAHSLSKKATSLSTHIKPHFCLHQIVYNLSEHITINGRKALSRSEDAVIILATLLHLLNRVSISFARTS